MRWLPKTLPFLIAMISLDFALLFGVEAFRIFTSPIYGLDQTAFASLVYSLGRLVSVADQGLFRIAGLFGGVYLTISAVFVLHLASRIAGHRGPMLHDLLDAGLILVVLVTMVAATPSILSGATDIMVLERLPLWLVGLAATLSMIERLPETDVATMKPNFAERRWMRFAARRERAERTIVSPAIRGRTTASRWDDLRNASGMVIEAAPIARAEGLQGPLRLR
jgi:hypothetical protein